MGIQDLGYGSTELQVRFPPSLEQGMRREQGEIALKYFFWTGEDILVQLKGKDK